MADLSVEEEKENTACTSTVRKPNKSQRYDADGLRESRSYKRVAKASMSLIELFQTEAKRQDDVLSDACENFDLTPERIKKVLQSLHTLPDGRYLLLMSSLNCFLFNSALER